MSPNGRLAALTHDTGVQIWDLHTHERLAQLDEPPDRVSSLRFSPDSRLLVGTCAFRSISTREGDYQEGLNPVFVWKVPSGELVQRFDEHHWPVTDAVFTSDARHVFSAGSEVVDGRTRVVVYQWDIATGTRVARFQGAIGEPVGVDLMSDDRKLVAANGPGRACKINKRALFEE